MADYKIKQLEVDNGIMEKLRLRCVALGYLPDFTAYPNAAAYEAAKAPIRTAGKRIIEVFGVGSARSKGTETDCRITMRRATPRPAQTGVGIDYDYDLNNTSGKYDKSKLADSKYDIEYTISYISKTEEYAAIIEGIMRDCFGIRGYVTAINDNAQATGHFWLLYRGEGDTSGDDFIERSVRYDAVNIDLQGNTSEGEIAPFTDFDFEVAATEPIAEADAITQANNEEPLFELDIETD